MTTIVGTQTDARDPGALPRTQTHHGSTATSKFVVSMHACLFVCVVECISICHACEVKVYAWVCLCAVQANEVWLTAPEFTTSCTFNFTTPLPLIGSYYGIHTHAHTHTLPHPLGLALSYVFSNSQNVYFSPAPTGLLFIVLCQLLCVVAKLHTAPR